MYENLTKKQTEVLNCITKFISKNSYPPSIREICIDVGLKSTSSVHAHLASLERLGYITKNNLKKRAVTPSNMVRYFRRTYYRKSNSRSSNFGSGEHRRLFSTSRVVCT